MSPSRLRESSPSSTSGTAGPSTPSGDRAHYGPLRASCTGLPTRSPWPGPAATPGAPRPLPRRPRRDLRPVPGPPPLPGPRRARARPLGRRRAEGSGRRRSAAGRSDLLDRRRPGDCPGARRPQILLAKTGPDRLVFSLDLFEGRALMGRPEAWGTDDPQRLGLSLIALGVRRCSSSTFPASA